MSTPDDKANNLKGKSELVRKTFNYPETETVIQDYSCSLKKGILIPGRLYITANFISYIPLLGESNESISFRKILDIKKDSTMFVDNAITFNTSSNNVSFGSFVHRDETYNLLYHLWKHPPLFYDPNAAEDEHLRQFNQQLQGGNNSNGSGGLNNSGTRSFGGGQQQTQQLKTKVDTESTRQALRIALETKETGIATMNELAYQAEVIDQMEYNIENIHSNLDRSDRLLKGMESVGGAISNAFSKDPNANKERPEYEKIDRSLKVRQRDEPITEIDILEKLANDFLQPGYMAFSADKFVILDVNKKPTPTGTYSYDQVEMIVVRARHHHVDFRLTNKNRIRICSAYIQNVVNEFVLRSNYKLGKSAKVVFEPGVRNFAYGNPTIRFIPSVGRQTTQQQGGFGRTSQLGVSNVIKNAPEDVRDALLQQDKDLDEISALLGDIHGIAVTIGNEADRQSEQLDRMTVKVDDASLRLQNSNKRINKML